MDRLPMERLEEAVGKMLQRNSQLQDRCDLLEREQQKWQQQRREMLAEVEGLLADLEHLREQNV